MKLQIIKQQEVLGQDFKVYGTAENPLFLAKDVATWIEHSNSTEMLRSIDENEKLNSTILSAGQNREKTFLTEDGLYEVLMQSRKPIAKQFKHEVKQILKDIRKHGIYATADTIEAMLNDPDTMIKTLQALKEERQERKRLESRVEADRPKVLFANAVETSHTSILVGDLAKIIRQNGIDIGQNRLFAWLREKGYLIKYGQSYNMPTQVAMDLKLFEVKETTITVPDGSVRITKTVKVTGKGQTYFVNKFLGQAG